MRSPHFDQDVYYRNRQNNVHVFQPRPSKGLDDRIHIQRFRSVRNYLFYRGAKWVHGPPSDTWQLSERSTSCRDEERNIQSMGCISSIAPHRISRHTSQYIAGSILSTLRGSMHSAFPKTLGLICTDRGSNRACAALRNANGNLALVQMICTHASRPRITMRRIHCFLWALLIYARLQMLGRSV